MGLINTVQKFLIKTFWPWFKAFVWPYLKEHVIDLVFFVLDRFKNQIKEWLSNRSELRQRDAEVKAESAEKKAESTTDPTEAERLRATAQVWREVAEQFRRDNEELKAKLDEMEAEAKAASEGIVQDIDFDMDFSKSRPVLKLGDRSHELPALPE